MSAAATLSRLIRSPGVAVVLLLALAGLAAVGTLTPPVAPDAVPATAGWPVAAARLVGLRQTFNSPLFLSLVALSVINVVACTWHRLAIRLRTGRVERRAVTDIMIHGSLVLLVAGGIGKVLFGFVGTQNIHVGGISHTAYDWRAGRDAPLGFAIGIDEFNTGYYPIRAMIGVRLVATGEKAALLEVVEGAEIASPGGEVRLSIAGYDPASGLLRLGVVTKGGRQELVLDTAGEKPVARYGDYDLALVAYRADIKDIQAVISLHEPGAGMAGKLLGPNTRIVYRGFSLFLTA